MLKSPVSARRPETIAESALVAAGHELEVEAGLGMLRAGGNAVDAAVAAAFVAELAEPAMCGIGAHGVASIFMADKQETTIIDFYDVAPVSVSPKMYRVLDAPGALMGWFGYPPVKDDAASVGYLSPMVPSQVAGLCAAQERFGRLPLAEAMAPAIGLAEGGVPVDRTTMYYLADSAHLIRRFPATAEYLLKDGLPLRAGTPWSSGDRIVRRDLGKTLRAIACNGSEVFYRGEIAEAIVSDVQSHGGLITLADLGDYQPLVYSPQPYSYRGRSYVTGGNVTLVETLNILECFDVGSLDPADPQSMHLMLEAMRLAWADTLMWVGDPRDPACPWDGLTSKGYARKRAAQIDLQRAHSEARPGDPWEFEDREKPLHWPWPLGHAGAWDSHTTKVVVADDRGNLVSLITSLGAPFGCKVTVPGTGILLNSSMERLDPRPGYLNSVAPRKGMQRLTAATLVMSAGRPHLALCGSLSIFTSGMGLHPMVNVLDFDMGVQEAIEAYRFHPVGEAIWLDARIPETTQEDLAGRGHRIWPLECAFGRTYFGNHVGIRVEEGSHRLRGGADPFHANAVDGY